MNGRVKCAQYMINTSNYVMVFEKQDDEGDSVALLGRLTDVKKVREEEKTAVKPTYNMEVSNSK